MFATRVNLAILTVVTLLVAGCGTQTSAPPAVVLAPSPVEDVTTPSPTPTKPPSMACPIPLPSQIAAKPVPKKGDFASERVKVGQVNRDYRLVVPKSVDVSQPAPLVIAFHGMIIDSKDVMPFYTKLSDAAEKHGFIIAYPNAIDGSWGLAPDKVSNDLALFDALLTKLSTEYAIDPARVYVLGMSNGGYFAHLVAKERSTIVAAVASHSGPLGLQTLFGVGAKRKFPVLIVHGAQDGLLSVNYARENRDKYKREGHEVKYVEVANLGHFWAVKSNINDTIWQFFADHPLPQPWAARVGAGKQEN